MKHSKRENLNKILHLKIIKNWKTNDKSQHILERGKVAVLLLNV